jgi:hypothetical protein
MLRFIGGGSTSFTPSSLFTSTSKGGDFTALSPTTCFSDTAGTTQATINGTVAAIRSLGGDITIVTQSTGANQPKLRGTPQGANLALADGNFFTPGNWTVGANWAIADSIATATLASSALSLAGLAATTGKVYLIRYYVTRTAGTVTPSFGGSAGTARSATGVYEEYITALGVAGFAYTGVGFTGTVSLLQIWAADTADVGSPYFLDFDASNDFLSASNTLTAYPFTLAAKVRPAQVAASMGAVALYQNDTDTKMIDQGNIRSVDWKEATVVAGGSGSLACDMVIVSDFTSTANQTWVQRIGGTATAHTNTFGTKTSFYIGKARSGDFLTAGRLYGVMAIDKSLTASEREDLEEYWTADGAARVWGNSMVAGSGTAIAQNWVDRLGRMAGILMENKGAGGETSAQIKTRFDADTGDKDKWINIFWMGENDTLYTSVGPTEINIAACVQGITGRQRYLVCGCTRSEGSSVTAAHLDELETNLLATYGDSFLDVRGYLQSKHDGSANDLADIADGLVPRSLRSDIIHLNDTGYQHIAELVYTTLKNKGWL